MGTKQLRLSDPAQIRQRVNEFLGKQINIVLHDRTVQYGTLTHADAAALTLRNLRQKSVKWPLASVAEVYVDMKV